MNASPIHLHYSTLPLISSSATPDLLVHIPSCGGAARQSQEQAEIPIYPPFRTSRFRQGKLSTDSNIRVVISFLGSANYSYNCEQKAYINNLFVIYSCFINIQYWIHYRMGQAGSQLKHYCCLHYNSIRFGNQFNLIWVKKKS